MIQTYYYPDNLTANPIILKFWSLKDIVIFGAIMVLSMLLVLLMQVWMTFIFAVIYGFLSMKFFNGYSIAKYFVFYVRYLITDDLILKWRGDMG